MKVKTAELIGDQLDLAVSIAHEDAGFKPVAYSTKWEFGGLLIDEMGIQLVHDGSSRLRVAKGGVYPNFVQMYGPTSLIAACRCYVASKLGDEVELPGGLE